MRPGNAVALFSTILVSVTAMTEQDGAHSLRTAGGPGDSGVAELGITVFKEILLQATGGVYDIIAWDPRGVGTLTTSVSFFNEYHTSLTVLI